MPFVLSICLLAVLSLPEAFDHRFTYGVLWYGPHAIHLADLLSLVILVLSLFAVVFSGTFVFSGFVMPLALLTTLLLVQGLRTFGVYDPQDILRDLRSLVSWLVIIALPQLYRTTKSRQQWVRWGIAVAVIPPSLVGLFTVTRYLLAEPFVTFGDQAAGRMTYVNGSVSLLVAMSGAAFLLSGMRKYQLLLGLSTILLGLLFVLSKSRGFLLEIVMLYSLLWFLSVITRRTLSYTFTIAVLTIISFMVSVAVMPQQTALAVTRVALHADLIESIIAGHDRGRLLHMQQQLADFVRYPITGTGLGRPYYALAGGDVGERLTSPSDSLLIDFAAKTGLFGVGAFLWIIFRYGKLLARLMRSQFVLPTSLVERSFIYGLSLTFPALILGSVIGNALWHYRTPPLHMALVISVVEAMYRIVENRRT